MGQIHRIWRETLVCFRSLGNKFGETEALNHLGSTYSAMGQYEPSLDCFSKALEISKEAGNKYNEARSYGGIGTVVCSLGNYEKSEENPKKSIEVFHGIGAERQEAFSYANLGVTYHYLSLPRNLLNARRKHLGFSERMEIREMCKVLSRSPVWDIFMLLNSKAVSGQLIFLLRVSKAIRIYEAPWKMN